MEELIKEADEMYDKLMRVIRHINTPEFDKDDSIAIIEASQLLRRLVERKDNIVDLSEVWKDGKKEKPIPCSDIVIRDCCITSGYDDVVDESQWAYLDDLLPKGGE